MSKPVLRGNGFLWPKSPKLMGAITVSREEMEKALEGLARAHKVSR
jgi:hypothetical protein